VSVEAVEVPVEECQADAPEAEACSSEGTDEAAAVPADHQGSEAVGENIGDLVSNVLARSLELELGRRRRSLWWGHAVCR